MILVTGTTGIKTGEDCRISPLWPRSRQINNDNVMRYSLAEAFFVEIEKKCASPGAAGPLSESPTEAAGAMRGLSAAIAGTTSPLTRCSRPLNCAVSHPHSHSIVPGGFEVMS